ncbi:MAG: 2-dehydro-3-deoxygalactonokinase [Novosphingobium lindaniclasticum]|jgi:2-dehydro-3-deoxygalactonokinase|uniref:2-dehydro-3-deoxygalactonokinase n=1 Tax=Novosphingobium lindaniclasticum TaxID=1329895 RepID=UPI00240A358E|nr:2-dehydro-3-deoxygalactonokinase [Novosphingobium lindaniclasticum]MDF2640250.1 2-dehydro-3-deoxygalactonokinase [Novosphingobium lindaniclasticum]
MSVNHVPAAPFVLGDWGTTRLRLFRLDGEDVVARLSGPGALEGDAEAALAERLDLWKAEGPLSEVVLCGMAGAPGALVAAGYAACPADAAQWLSSRARLEVAGIPVSVLPGLSCKDSEGVPEVMRGEEAQVFGALALHPELGSGEHLIALPGTHCKWVSVVNGTIVGFRTHPTGELFALLAGQSTLTGPEKLPDGTAGEGTFDEGFARGLDRCEDSLTGALFEARAARMLDGRSKDWSRGYISGLLIGGEVSAQVPTGISVVLIGDPALSALYDRALAARGCTSRKIDGDAAVLAGLAIAKGQKA